MGRTVYVDGKYVPEDQAVVSVFDRGYLFADAIYEVTSIIEGRLIDFDDHMMRLKRSLSEMKMAEPLSADELLSIHRELIRLNNTNEGCIYLHVSRGTPPDRDFEFPAADVAPTVVLFTQDKSGFLTAPAALNGIKVISVEDLRWGRRDIKTVQLLYPSMAKMIAKEAGANDAWMVEDGMITEGTSNNAYIVKDKTIVTRQLGHEILAGITRAAVLRLAQEAGMKIEERGFTIDEALAADEAFITSSTTLATPVIELDGKAIGSGKPGPVVKRLREIYIEEAHRTAI